MEGNNFNYEKTYHSYAGARGGLAFEFVHDRRRKAGRPDYDHDDHLHREEKHGPNDHGGANDHSLLVAFYGN